MSDEYVLRAADGSVVRRTTQYQVILAALMAQLRRDLDLMHAEGTGDAMESYTLRIPDGQVARIEVRWTVVEDMDPSEIPR